ncbi:MAG: hypothetical protein EOP38_21595 [Rubrivivax sp.]|nr:MAG: hypothetical protein EOP38_21595 [Rubrivivax sp.]
MPSFFNERTAEYALVPALQAHLQAGFQFAVPIFYWKTREGNSIAERVHHDEPVKVLAMFARRPKLSDDSGVVHGKINHDLLNYAQRAGRMGIPTIAGFPAVASLFDLHLEAPLHWFFLGGLPEMDIEFMVDLQAKPSYAQGIDSGLQPIHLAEITELVKKAPAFSWQDAMARLAELRVERSHGYPLRFNWFGSQYKPVYFLVSPKQRSA